MAGIQTVPSHVPLRLGIVGLLFIGSLPDHSSVAFYMVIRQILGGAFFSGCMTVTAALSSLTFFLKTACRHFSCLDSVVLLHLL